jgi:hypothetical protein
MRLQRLAIIGLLALVGCGDGGERTANDLRQIGLAYHGYCDAQRKGPASEKDLAPYYENSERLSGALRSGRYVFLWGVSVMDLGKRTYVVIGYEKDVPTSGGYVLFANASVRKMSAQEFQSAAKAKAKEKDKP